jgi:hypothetical protein
MAENQDEIKVNNALSLGDEKVSEVFLREDLKQVAETTSLFDSIKSLQDMSKSRDESSEMHEPSTTVYTGKRYKFILKNNAQETFFDINPVDDETSEYQYSEDPINNHYTKTINNGKNKGLKQGDILQNSSLTVWQSDYRKIFQRLIKNYPTKNISQVQEFFTRFTNALMFELSRNTKSDMKAYARMKSQFSFLGKSFYRASAHNQKPINDLFGIKLVLDSTNDTLPVSDPLMQQKVENDKRIIHFQELVDSYLVDTSFVSGLKTSEYYEKFIELLDSFENVVSPKAVEYKEFVAEKKKFLQDKLTRLNALGLTDAKMTEGELKLDDEFRIFYDLRKKYTSDFAAVLAKYKELNNDLINYPILCNQVDDIFKNSKILGQFGVSIVKEDYKDNAKGYQAKFIVLDTPVGRMEIQLQTDNQMREGMTGFNAHDKFKSIPPLPIIPPKGDKDKWNDFIDAVDFVSPFAFTIEEDNLATDELTMKTTYDSRHLSLKKVIQVAKDSPIYTLVNKYLSATYSLLSSDAKPQESLQISDVIDYLHSDALKQLKDSKAAQIAVAAVEQAEQIGGSAPTTPSEGTASSHHINTSAHLNRGRDDMEI